MMNSQGSDTEKNNLIEEGKKIGINELIKRNEIINNSLQPSIKNEILLLKVLKKKKILKT